MQDNVINRDKEIERLKVELLSLKQSFKFISRNDSNYKEVRDSIISLSNKIDCLEQRNNVIKSFYEV
jgi:hypothetical protein